VDAEANSRAAPGGASSPHFTCGVRDELAFWDAESGKLKIIPGQTTNVPI